MMKFCFLARDSETGMIVDDGFWVYRPGSKWSADYDPFASREERKRKIERYVREFCKTRGLDLIDYDAFSEFLCLMGFRKCKWAHQRPANISEDEWESRLKSTEELEAYKAANSSRLEAQRREIAQQGPIKLSGPERELIGVLRNDKHFVLTIDQEGGFWHIRLKDKNGEVESWQIRLAGKNIDKIGEGHGPTFKDAWDDIASRVELPGERPIARVKSPL